ncbi:chemotaxis protein CheB [Lichenifustis flavocetrariae]|uniref:protein-glutamate methylesterase n=1 Tax=Lichenifustis flavocetrariae TaxID=2949735 RepID=A0AA41Z9Y2_9HYPH|nr:chemotaxis protein CheB [Lichenifustis flavocetrariae]MCW6513193.1 chemotaxis protein CheB [Lichenifustis flavocetrariae]
MVPPSPLSWISEMEDYPAPWFVAIGASGGKGLSDIQAILSLLPRALKAIVLIVLHRPWDHLSHLQEVLARASLMPVRTAANGTLLEMGNAYIGAPGDHLTLAAGGFGVLVSDPFRKHRNRTIDLLFRSVAAHGGNRMIGVVLSGALDDGARGLTALHEAGGLSMVLTPTEPPDCGMPENAINYDGPIDRIGNPSDIALAICEAVSGKDRKSNRRSARECRCP